MIPSKRLVVCTMLLCLQIGASGAHEPPRGLRRVWLLQVPAWLVAGLRTVRLLTQRLTLIRPVGRGFMSRFARPRPEPANGANNGRLSCGHHVPSGVHYRRCAPWLWRMCHPCNRSPVNCYIAQVGKFVKRPAWALMVFCPRISPHFLMKHGINWPHCSAVVSGHWCFRYRF